MGSSSRKRSAKKADFTKPKLKVGKARAKPTNFTDTSFKSRSIAIPPQQSLHTTAPTAASSLLTHLSHLTSHHPALRADHLAALHHALLLPQSSSPALSPLPLPLPASTLLRPLPPLLLDPSSRVRALLLPTLALFPPADLADHVPGMLPYVRAAITSLSAGVRGTGLEALAWLCACDAVVVGRAVVGGAGGWVRGVKCLGVVLGWSSSGGGGGGGGGQQGGAARKGAAAEWTDVSGMGGAGQGKLAGGGGGGGVRVQALGTLAAFLRCGLLTPEKRGGGGEEEGQAGRGRGLVGWPLWNVRAHMLPDRPDAYGYLNLFGEKRDEEGEVYEDAEDRRRVFRSLGYEAAISRGVEGMRKEGGEVGRAAAMVGKVLKEVEDLAE